MLARGREIYLQSNLFRGNCVDPDAVYRHGSTRSFVQCTFPKVTEGTFR